MVAFYSGDEVYAPSSSNALLQTALRLRGYSVEPFRANVGLEDPSGAVIPSGASVTLTATDPANVVLLSVPMLFDGARWTRLYPTMPPGTTIAVTATVGTTSVSGGGVVPEDPVIAAPVATVAQPFSLPTWVSWSTLRAPTSFTVWATWAPTGPADATPLIQVPGSATGTSIPGASILSASATVRVQAENAGTLSGSLAAGSYFSVKSNQATVGVSVASATRVLTGGAGLQTQATAVTTDPGGNALMSGFTSGSLPGFTNQGQTDAFVAKFAPNGDLLWVQQFGGAGPEWSFGVATDALGFVYVGGFSGVGGMGQASPGIWVAKYSPAGVQQTVGFLATSSTFQVKGMAIDRARSVVYLGVDDFGGGAHVYAFDTASLALLRSATVPGVGSKTLNAVQVDPAGSVYVTGSLVSGTVQGLITKFTPDFQLLWQTVQTGLNPAQDQTRVLDVAIGPDGDPRVVAADTSVPLGSGPVAAYRASTGALVWRTEFLGNAGGWPQPAGLAVDGVGNAYTVGLTYGSLDGGPPLTSGNSGWIAKYSPTGAFLGVDQIRSAATWSTRAAADANSNLWVVGLCQRGRIDLAACQDTNYDAFIVKYDANLVRQ
jgi:hypothetical protein